ncbi:hypothetical protein [Curtobacterium sp. L1-20]|uniref:hypothetical protein n=1 Tax=Curtobacterium sp. L1-20 TaxID=3138181 RepID=UPI003B529B2E
MGDAYNAKDSYSYAALSCNAEGIYALGDLIPGVDTLSAPLTVACAPAFVKDAEDQIEDFFGGS